MGQSQSHQQELASSDDRISLFIPYHESTTSLSSDQRYDDVLTRNYQNNRNFKACRKLSKLKKSFSECFRSKFHHLKEVEIDSEPKLDSEIISAQRPNSEMSNVVVTESRVRHLSESNDFVTQSIPRDIQEIHHQLNELKRLLLRPDIVNDPVEKRDESCQTNKIESKSDQLLWQKENLIASQQDQLNNLRISLENRTKLVESLTKELSNLKAQQSRRHADIEPKILDQFISLLKSIRIERKLDSCDLDKFDEGINLVTSLSISTKTQNDKTNVAIINPCSKNDKDLIKHGFSRISSPLQTEELFGQALSLNSALDGTKLIEEKSETKIIYFLGKSPIPYSSEIPMPLAAVTLADVKEYTNSILSKDKIFHYFFKTNNPDFGSTKQEVVRDHDPVPGIDGKIIVYIQQ